MLRLLQAQSGQGRVVVAVPRALNLPFATLAAIDAFRDDLLATLNVAPPQDWLRVHKRQDI